MVPHVFVAAIVTGFICVSNPAASPPQVSTTVMKAEAMSVAALPGEPRLVSAAGVTKDESAILTIENPSAFDPSVTKRRLALVGTPDNDGRNAAAIIALVRWFKTRAPRAIREQWDVSALPSAHFEVADAPALTRWVTFQAPDLIVTIGSDPVERPDVPSASMAIADPPAALEKLLAAARGRSPLRETLLARVQRDPITMARVLAKRYPEAPSISYIPAVAWAQTLRLAGIVKDDSLREKVRQQTRPWIAGEKKPFGDRIQLTAVAGTMIFAELAAAGDAAALPLAEQGAALAAAEKAPATPEYGQGWTDDMFMTASILARMGERSGREHDLDMAAGLLTAYAGRLQRTDGLFNHAVDGPAAWGRGNGFAALGLIEVLTRLPATHAARAKVLDIYRRQMAAALAQQAPDGMWRQIVDEPGAYREETATAMLMTAMARGIRLGWLDRSYLPAVQRAWRALAAHVTDEGTLIDVCAGTGSGPTRRYYFDRPAVTGADDRGGAMALLASMEMYELGNVR